MSSGGDSESLPRAKFSPRLSLYLRHPPRVLFRACGVRKESGVAIDQSLSDMATRLA
jgi:hypothetical protein